MPSRRLPVLRPLDKTPSPRRATLPPSSLSQASASTPQSSPLPPPVPVLPSSTTSKATDTAHPAHSNPHCPTVEQSVPSSLQPPERSSTPAAIAPPRTQECFPAPPS